MPILKKMPRALVAGCAGFIGSHLVESLLQKNILVTGVDNLSTGKKIYLEHSLQNSNFNFVQFDLNVGIPKEIENFKYDYIFHLASTESHNKDDKDGIEYEILLTNSLATRNLLEFATENNSKFVLASSLGIYQGFVSSVSLENYFGSSEEEEKTFSYSEAKRFAEALSWQYYKKNGLDVRIVRLSEVYGPRMSLKSSASLGTLLDYYLHDQDLIVSGDGLTKERYSYVADAVNLLELSILNENSKGLILPLVPNLTTPLEIAYLLKDISNGALDILFRPSKKVDIIPTVEKIDVSSLAKIGFQITTSFKDGINETIAWFGKITENTVIPQMQVKNVPQTEERINPNVNLDNKTTTKISTTLKKLSFVIFLILLLTGIFIFLYTVYSEGIFTSNKIDTTQFVEKYKQGKYQDILSNIENQENSRLKDIVANTVINKDGVTEDYLVNYLVYISRAKFELTRIYTNIFSKQAQNRDLVRVSSIVANIDAANRYLSLYQSSLDKKESKLDIKQEQQLNKTLLILTNNTAELFSGDKKYLLVLTDATKSSYYLGQPIKQILLHTNNYTFVEATDVDVATNLSPNIDFAEYSTEFINASKSKLGADINGVLFIDSKVLSNVPFFDFVISVINGTDVNVDSLTKAIQGKKIIFFPTSSDVSIAGDLGITPVLAFSDSSDFIITNLNNTGGTDSSLYLISNVVYSLTENVNSYSASLTLTLLHMGNENNKSEGLFSGNVNLLFPASSSMFDVKSGGSLWKKSLEYQLTKAKYDTNLISYPIVLYPKKSNTVTINYQLTKPTNSGYNLIVPNIANVKLQNFTFKFRPLDPSKFHLQDFQNDGGVYQYTTSQKSNLTIQL